MGRSERVKRCLRQPHISAWGKSRDRDFERMNSGLAGRNNIPALPFALQHSHTARIYSRWVSLVRKSTVIHERCTVAKC